DGGSRPAAPSPWSAARAGGSVAAAGAAGVGSLALALVRQRELRRSTWNLRVFNLSKAVGQSQPLLWFQQGVELFAERPCFRPVADMDVVVVVWQGKAGF